MLLDPRSPYDTTINGVWLDPYLFGGSGFKLVSKVIWILLNLALLCQFLRFGFYSPNLTPDPCSTLQRQFRSTGIRAQVWSRSRVPLTWLLFYTCCKQATLCILTPDHRCTLPSILTDLVVLVGDQGSSFILQPHNLYKQNVALPIHHKQWAHYIEGSYNQATILFFSYC